MRWPLPSSTPLTSESRTNSASRAPATATAA
ncbi:Uncharacterised protein [Vibrio cholerae]|nr:Uncharacterised protein [Vibrio cholerae]